MNTSDNYDIENRHTAAAIESRVQAIFCKQLQTQVPSVETDLLETGILDSLKFVELLLALETELDTKLAVHELEFDNFRSIRNIAIFITERQIRNQNSLQVRVPTGKARLVALLASPFVLHSMHILRHVIAR